MLDSEWISGAAHAGHDFVGDEKNSAIATNFRDALYVTFRRSGAAERCSDDGFEDERGDGCGIVCGEERFEIVGAGDVAGWKCFVEGTVVAETGRDVAPLGKERLKGSAAGDVTADGHGAESAAMVALTARDDTEFFWRAGFEMELAGKFNGSFGGFGTAGSEVDATSCKIWRSKGEKA